MPELIASEGFEEINLPDADLRLWHEVDLGSSQAGLFEQLVDVVEWRQETVTVYGKTWPQPRLVAWYGDGVYRYSGLRLEPLPWIEPLRRIKQRVEALTGTGFNSVLLNYYRNGRDSMGLHSDDETELGERPQIASLSLGATRNLIFKHRSRKDLKTYSLPLPGGSLLLMRGETQSYWRHGINKTRRDCGARINLTFRRVYAVPGG